MSEKLGGRMRMVQPGEDGLERKYALVVREHDLWRRRVHIGVQGDDGRRRNASCHRSTRVVTPRALPYTT
jgi:hypothetical protein